VLGGSWPTGFFDGLGFAASKLPTRAQHVLKRLLLYGFVHHTPGTEARHHRAVRSPQHGCVRVAGQVEAVAFGQLGWSVCCPHALLNVARRLLDHTRIHRSAWKVEFSDVRGSKLPHSGRALWRRGWAVRGCCCLLATRSPRKQRGILASGHRLLRSRRVEFQDWSYLQNLHQDPRCVPSRELPVAGWGS